MPNSDDKRQIAERFLSGLRTRDWVLLRTIVTQDVVWTLPGHSRISGEARGIDAVIEQAQTIVSYGVTFNLNHILEGQGGLACLCITPLSARARFSTSTSRPCAGFAKAE